MRLSLLSILLVAGATLAAQNSLHFDGVDDHVTTAFGGPIGSADRTVECWIKTSNSKATQQVIIDYGVMSPLGSRFTLNLINFGLLRIEVGGNGFNSSQSIADGNWHHVAITYDNGATTKFTMYIDGQLETSQNTTVPVNTASTGVFLGQRNDGVNYFEGTLDEVRIWNTVRSQNDINTYKNQEFCSLPTGLMLYYKFNQGIAGGSNAGVTTLNNETGSNNGTLSNFALSGTTSNWVSGVSMTSAAAMIQDTVSACDSLLSPSGNYVWTTTGVYYDTLVASVGCDTIIEVDLTVTSIDTSITVNPKSLQANMNGANYQWLNCDANYDPVPGETQALFTPASIGNYAVQIELNGCVDTSRCYFINPAFGQSEWGYLSIKTYPVPISQGQDLEITLPNPAPCNYKILSSSGKLLRSGDFAGHNSNFILPINFDSGIYLLLIEGDNYRGDSRIVVQ